MHEHRQSRWVCRGTLSFAPGFNAAVLDEASRPFDKSRDGFVMGEGAGMLVIEELSHALARGAKPLAELVGYGTTADAHHVTSGPEDGDGARRAMEIAIAQAGISPREVRHLNAHATSTPVGDLGEIEAIKSVFGRDFAIAVSATKSATGHLLGAAGGLGAIFAILALRDQVAPPTPQSGRGRCGRRRNRLCRKRGPANGNGVRDLQWLRLWRRECQRLVQALEPPGGLTRAPGAARTDALRSDLSCFSTPIQRKEGNDFHEQRPILASPSSQGHPPASGAQPHNTLRNAGFRVFGTSRRMAAEKSEGVTMLTCDVTDDASVATMVDEVLAKTGRIDLLVNNAGMGLLGGAEESSIAQAQALFDVNVFGVFRVTNAVLPTMRRQGRGRIVNLRVRCWG